MSRLTLKPSKGYFGIGIYRCKTGANLGSLWRSAHIMGADYIFTIDHKYKHQDTDTTKASNSIPLFQYPDFDTFFNSMPTGAPLVGIELSDAATMLPEFEHPHKATYLLGAENIGLPPSILAQCHRIIQVPTVLEYSLNVSNTGTLVMYDRLVKGVKK